MYLRVTNRAQGKYMIIYEKFWDKKSKQARERAVLTPGYVHLYADQFDDPIEHFKEVARQMTLDKQNESSVSISINLNDKFEEPVDDLKNIGYIVFKHIYKELEIDKFWKSKTSHLDVQFDIEKIFRLLVFSRLLFPASKKKSFEDRHLFFESFGDFSLDDLYRALDIFAAYEDELQLWIYDHSITRYSRDVSVGYFDCTNYYYDISKPDIDLVDEEGNLILKKYRKYGPEKNHRKDPIVELGLLMDRTGIPLTYDLFPGNESEKVHMLPIVKRARSRFGFGRFIVVADRGINTSDNIYYLNGNNKSDDNPRDGYVYGQSIRGADAEFKKWVLDQSGYIDTPITNPNDPDDKVFRHKSRIYPKKIHVTVEKADGSTTKKQITVDQKQMVYYSEKYAKKQRLERERTIARATDLIAHPKKYDKVSAKGASGYVINLAFDPETGEVMARDLQLNIEKIQEEEKYDGYYSIVTSELKMDDLELRSVYRGLAKIEDTFKVTKSELDTRPIYVWTNEHIEAHFTTCFTAVVLIRLLEMKLGNKYTASQILASLKKYNCFHIDKNTFKFVYYDDIIADCAKAYGIELNHQYRTTNQIRRLLKY